MPELPEAERARQVLEQALGKRIVGVDDHDTYVSRPHSPGEIADALTGHELTSAHRRGKFLWLETDGGGPELGLHLGMAGRLVLEDGAQARGVGGPPPRWDRFALKFADGTRLVLRDKRRLGRAVLNPDFSHVGPDAADVSRDEFRRLIGRGHTPIKARLLNQHAISGIGNLLADEILWQARIAPDRDVSALSEHDLDALRRAVRAAVRSAVRKGGAHTGRFISARHTDGSCPRCGHRPLARARFGGRTTYWCPVCQPS